MTLSIAEYIIAQGLQPNVRNYHVQAVSVVGPLADAFEEMGKLQFCHRFMPEPPEDSDHFYVIYWSEWRCIDEGEPDWGLPPEWDYETDRIHVCSELTLDVFVELLQ